MHEPAGIAKMCGGFSRYCFDVTSIFIDLFQKESSIDRRAMPMRVHLYIDAAVGHLRGFVAVDELKETAPAKFVEIDAQLLAKASEHFVFLLGG